MLEHNIPSQVLVHFMIYDKKHKNTKGMDACASSYIMHRNVNKRFVGRS